MCSLRLLPERKHALPCNPGLYCSLEELGRSYTRLTGALPFTASRTVLFFAFTDFKTSNDPGVHVVLTTADDPALQSKTPGSELHSVEIAVLKGNEGDKS